MVIDIEAIEARRLEAAARVLTWSVAHGTALARAAHNAASVALAASGDDVPTLVAEVRRLRAELAKTEQGEGQ